MMKPKPWVVTEKEAGELWFGDGYFEVGPAVLWIYSKAEAHLIAAACNAVQEAGISIEALEQRPTLIREMVEVLRELKQTHPFISGELWQRFQAILAALEVKE